MKVKKRDFQNRATKIFTDREEPRKAFWNKYELVFNELGEEDPNIHVLSYYGIGGIGKSTLIKKLMSEMDEKCSSPRYVDFDFKNAHERCEVLTRLKNKLIEKYRFSFPLFELGAYIFARKQGVPANAPEVKRLTDKSPCLSLVLSVAGNIPGVSLVSTLFNLIDEGQSTIRTISRKHRQELREMESMETEELYDYLLVLFSDDMNNNLREKDGEPLVVFLDTYEQLVNELSQTGDPLTKDEWIRGENGIIQNIPHVLWVIAGREKLKWERFDSGWTNALEQHILGDLSFSDSVFFLEARGIKDEQLRRQLYELTNGTPIYLDLCVDQYDSIIESGRTPSINLYGGSVEDLVERFVRYMNESQQTLVYILACMQKWDDSLFIDVAKEMGLADKLVSYERIKDYSFVITMDDGRYSLHQTVGEILSSKCSSSIKRLTGEALRKCFAGVVAENNVFSLDYAEALYRVTMGGLLMYTDREKLYDFFRNEVSDRVMNMARAGRAEYAAEILDLVSEYANRNKTDLFYASVLMTRDNFARLFGGQTNENAAEEAVEIFRSICGVENLDTLAAMQNLAYSYGYKGKKEKALEIHLEVLDRQRELLGDNSPLTMKTEISVANAYRGIRDGERAQEIKQNVYDKMRESFGENNVNTVKAMFELADICHINMELEKARELYERGIKILEGLQKEEIPDVLAAMFRLASVYFDMGIYDQSIRINEFLAKRYSESLGESHEYTLSAMSNQARSCCWAGQYKEALKLYGQVFERCRNILGEDAPDTIAAMKNLADTYYTVGEYDRAAEQYKYVVEKSKVKNPTNMAAYMAKEQLRDMQYSEYVHQRIRDSLWRIAAKQSNASGVDQSDEIVNMCELAITHVDKDEYQFVLELLRRMSEKQDAGESDWFTDVLTAMVDLARVFIHLFEFDLAEDVLLYVVKERERISGKDSLDTIDAMDELSCVYRGKNKTEEGVEIARKVESVREEKLGTEHEDTILSMERLAHGCFECGLAEEAIEWLHKVVEKRRSMLGDDDMCTVWAMYYLIFRLHLLGRNAEELAMREHVLKRFREEAIVDHHCVLNIMRALAAAYEHMGEKEKAEILTAEVNVAHEKIFSTLHLIPISDD